MSIKSFRSIRGHHWPQALYNLGLLHYSYLIIVKIKSFYWALTRLGVRIGGEEAHVDEDDGHDGVGVPGALLHRVAEALQPQGHRS